ncbi:MAG TPA: hypothetical protein VKS23_09080 [Thermoanaerobaculia bacterium]|nr:hypothetical protein [Thermoanaerobaculia bacterium]
MQFKKLQSRSDYKLASYTGHHSDGVCACVVVGFATNSFVLNSHQVGLLSMGVPMLQRPPSVLEMYARTDRSGSDEYNMGLSRRRLLATQDTLVSVGAPNGKVFTDNAKALGENFDRFMGMEDESRAAGGRAVWLFFWPSQAAFDEGPDDSDDLSLGTLVHFGRDFTPPG